MDLYNIINTCCHNKMYRYGWQVVNAMFVLNMLLYKDY
jgi:hypothetical protein